MFLKAEQAAGRIAALRCQVRFKLVVNGVKVAVYVCDFLYVQNGVRVVEDVKSEMTAKLPTYRLKRSLMKACHGIDIREVK